MKTRIASGENLFEEMLGDINYSKKSEAGKLYPFKVRVGCVKRRPPRHEFFEFLREMGSGDIDLVFNGESFGGAKTLLFVFPERWMGVAEQSAFMYVLKRHPEAKTLEQVDILTSSPMIIGNFMSAHIRVLTWPDDDNYNGAPEFVSS